MLVPYNSREWFRVEKTVHFPICVVLKSDENTFAFNYRRSRCDSMWGFKHVLYIFTFGPRGRRARSARRPRGQNVEESPWTGVSSGPLLQFSKCDFALLTNPAYVIGWLNQNNPSYICVINFNKKFNKNQLMFVVRKSVTAQIKKKVILFFS